MGGRKNDEGKAPLWILPWPLLRCHVEWHRDEGAKLLWMWSRGKVECHNLYNYLTPVRFKRAAEVLVFGAHKYELDNWMGGFLFTRIISAGLRHAIAEEEIDHESGLPHASHLDCNILFAWWQMLDYPKYANLDDRDGKKR